jgi:hypothetical protein
VRLARRGARLPSRDGKAHRRGCGEGATAAYPSNVDTAASVSLSGSDSPARESSTTLTATSSITGVEPVSSNRAQACLNARFIASRRSSSLTLYPLRTRPWRVLCTLCCVAHSKLCAARHAGPLARPTGSGHPDEPGRRGGRITGRRAKEVRPCEAAHILCDHGSA